MCEENKIPLKPLQTRAFRHVFPARRGAPPRDEPLHEVHKFVAERRQKRMFVAPEWRSCSPEVRKRDASFGWPTIENDTVCLRNCNPRIRWRVV